MLERDVYKRQEEGCVEVLLDEKMEPMQRRHFGVETGRTTNMGGLNSDKGKAATAVENASIQDIMTF